MNKLGATVMVVAVAFAVLSHFRAEALASDLEDARTEADSILGEEVARRLAADSVWSVRFANTTQSLQARLADREGRVGDLARELADARVIIRSLTEVAASAEGQIRSLSDSLSRVDSISEVGEVFGQWSGQVDDGILTGSWLFELPDAEHTLDYRVGIAGEIIASETGDGRTLVTARALDPRASLNVGEVFVDPPEPEVERRLSIKQAVIAALIGAIGWEFAR